MRFLCFIFAFALFTNSCIDLQPYKVYSSYERSKTFKACIHISDTNWTAMESFARNLYPDKHTKKSITLIFVPNEKMLFTFDEQGFPALKSKEEVLRFHERTAAFYSKNMGSIEGEFHKLSAR